LFNELKDKQSFTSNKNAVFNNSPNLKSQKDKSPHNKTFISYLVNTENHDKDSTVNNPLLAHIKNSQ
jgi:hypothetical protein